jgi:hypothetical protein
MDIDSQKENKNPLNNSLSSSSSSNFVYLRVDNGKNLVGIPTQLKQYFPHIVDIVEEIQPDNNILEYDGITKETLDFIIKRLVNKNNPNYTPESIIGQKALINIANAADILHIDYFKKICNEILLKEYKNKTEIFGQNPNFDKTSKLDRLNNFYKKNIKKNILNDFKLFLRDKNPFFEAPIKILGEFNSHNAEELCISDDGNIIAFIDNQGDLQWENIKTGNSQKKTLISKNNDQKKLSLNYDGSKI